MTNFRFKTLVTIFLLAIVAAALAQQRFPPPDFGPEYQMPDTTTPPPTSPLYDWLDLAVLITTLAIASYLTLKNRNRTNIFILMVFSLIYFGFWREGCVCPIGAIQNVTLALFDSSYTLPLVALAFFVLPLIFTIFFGRGFCAGVCPLGAIQDVVLVHPLQLPAWLSQALGLLAYVYLGAAILFAATGSAFIICEYDPFVSFFRLNGSINMLVLGGCFLLIGMFVGRPYCRFFCPYGVLLRLMSRVSKWRITITPKNCIQCRLCEESCPFGAIDKPTPQQTGSVQTRDRARLAALMIMLPIIMVLAGLLISRLSTPFSRMNATVRLAELVYLQQSGQITEPVDELDAFRATAKPPEQLYLEARNIHDRFVWGGWILGAFLGLVIGGKLIRLSVFRRQTEYQAHRAYCLACGRCFAYCPVHQQNPKEKLAPVIKVES